MLTEDDFRAVLLLEKAPPGMEPMVRKLKKKKGIDNPFAIAWAKYNQGESMGSSSCSALLKGNKKESIRIIHEAGVMNGSSSVPARKDGLEGNIVRVVLLTEGLGNIRDKNYYGPEAVMSMPLVFEGAPMMVDHPSYSEERDIPEGRVNKTVGYYKNLHVETLEGKSSCIGEVHFDQSEEGRNAYQKACTAVHYAHEFPGMGKEYVGLSVNAQGESEPRTMIVEGSEMDVNYVLRFVEARSCDMVTIPARGGKFVALVESIAGARMQKEETRMETLKRLEAAQAALKEAESEKDSKKRQEKTAEARKEVESLLKDLKEAAAKKTAEAYEKKEKKEEESEVEDEAESEVEDEAESETEMEDDSQDDGDDDDASGGDSHTTVTHKVVKKTGKAAMHAESKKDDGAMEANRLAIDGLIDKYNIRACFTKEHLTKLSKGTFREAKVEIERMKTMSEASVAKVLKQIGVDAPVAHRTKESGEAGASVEPSNNQHFASLEA